MAATGAGFSQFQERGANCNELLERRATTKWGKPAPSLRLPFQHAKIACRAPWVVAQIRPYFVLALDLGTTKAFGLGLA